MNEILALNNPYWVETRQIDKTKRNQLELKDK